MENKSSAIKTIMSYKSAIISLTLSGFFEKCCNAASPKNMHVVIAVSKRQWSLITERMPIAPIAIFANPSSLITTKLSRDVNRKISRAVNSGSDACLMPAVKSRIPTAQKINHLATRVQCREMSSFRISTVTHVAGSIHRKLIFINR